MRTHGIVQLIPAIWVVPLVVISLNALFLFADLPHSAKGFLFKESKWVYFSIIILVIHLAFQHGNFKLFSTLSYLITSVPFYIIGYYYGFKNKDYFISKILIIYHFILSLYLLPKTYVVLVSSEFSADSYNALFVESYDLDFILFWPFAAFVTVIGLAFSITSKSTVLRQISIFFGGTNLIAFILCSKAAPFVFLVLSFLAYNILKKNNALKYLLYLPLTFLLSLLMLYIIGNGYLGDLGSLKSKSAALYTILLGASPLKADNLDNVSFGRFTAGLYSIKQFLQAPIFGNGAFAVANTGNLGQIQGYTSASGNHSFFLDTLAFYGISGIPLILIFLRFINNGFKYYKKVVVGTLENKTLLLWISFVVAIFTANILNSTLLFSVLDNYLFLVGGYFLGKYYYVLQV